MRWVIMRWARAARSSLPVFGVHPAADEPGAANGLCGAERASASSRRMWIGVLFSVGAVVLAACEPRTTEIVRPNTPEILKADLVTRVDAGPPEDAGAREKDWMWEVLGGERKVWIRGADTCRSWRLQPEGLPGYYEGQLVLEAADGPLGVRFEYQGSPPVLSEPRAVLGKEVLAMNCHDGGSDLHLSEEACMRGEPAPIKASGCSATFSQSELERARKSLGGQYRQALLAKLVATKRFWRGEDCSITFVREGKDPYSPTKGTFLRNQKPVFLIIETEFWPYPSILRPMTFGGIAVEEEPIPNLHERPKVPGEALGTLGCCADLAPYEVLDVTADRVELRLRSRSKDRYQAARKTETWYFDQKACKAGRTNR